MGSRKVQADSRLGLLSTKLAFMIFEAPDMMEELTDASMDGGERLSHRHRFRPRTLLIRTLAMASERQ